MIINYRGTSGSGKSHLIHTIKGLYPRVEPQKVIWRDNPIGYVCYPDDGRPSLYLVGHYETTCGGCDTIDTIENVYKYVHRALDKGYDVLYEGLVLQSDTNRCIALKDKDLHVIFLDVHIDVCLDAVQSRRSERGDDRAFSPKNTIVKSTSFTAQKRKFTAAGVQFYEMTRDEALYFSMQKLGWPVGEPPVKESELNFVDTLDPATVPEWLKPLLPFLNEGTVVERPNILNHLKSCLLIRKNYDESKIRPIVQVLDGQTLLEGAIAMAWMARRLTMRAAYLDDTVLAARTIWADWGRAKEVDRISNLILDEMEVQSFV
jgi:energy-coupling factor transporter ATP-binding protein EcfA2